MKTRVSQRRRGREDRGFTLRDLLAVLAVSSLLLLLFLPARATNEGAAVNLTCLNHQRQLFAAWQMFADDHSGNLPGNGGNNTTPATTWCAGWLDYTTNPANTNRALMLASQVGLYARDAELYRCPADQSTARFSGRNVPRVRSVSMNSYVGGDGWEPGWRLYRKSSDLTQPAPASLWVLIDEHPESINDGTFVADVRGTINPTQTQIIDFPASYHAGGAGIVFADGHGEIHRWRDPRTSPVRLSLNVPSPNNPDMIWLGQRTSSRLQP